MPTLRLYLPFNLWLMLSAFGLAACDVIGDADRIRSAETLQFTNKVVLLEEFTGHKCVNCPAASEEAARLESWCEGHLVVVGIHAGSYANTSGSAWKYDFRTEAGAAYEAYFRPDGYPAAMIDRKTTDGKITHDNFSVWSALVLNSLAETAPVDIRLETSRLVGQTEERLDVSLYREGIPVETSAAPRAVTPVKTAVKTSNKISIATAHETPHETPSKTLAGTPVKVLSEKTVALPAEALSLQIWLVEDSVEAPQLTSDNSILWDYRHRHVLRDAVNGIWGDEIRSDFSAAIPWQRSYRYTLRSEWNRTRCRFVVFVYRTKTREILQTAQIPLAGESAPSL